MELRDLQSDLLVAIHKAESLLEIELSLVKAVNLLIDNNLFNWQILVFLENLEQKLRAEQDHIPLIKERLNVEHAIDLVTMFRRVVQLKSFSLS